MTSKKLNPYTCKTDSYGGNVKDQPKNLKRYFPGPRKREVRLYITRYYGVGQHYFPSLQPESNPAYNPKEKAWQVCWDDSEEIKGEDIFGPRFISWSSAANWARETFDKMFDSKYYVLTESYTGKKIDFSTYREGD